MRREFPAKVKVAAFERANGEISGTAQVEGILSEAEAVIAKASGTTFNHPNSGSSAERSKSQNPTNKED